MKLEKRIRPLAGVLALGFCVAGCASKLSTKAGPATPGSAALTELNSMLDDYAKGSGGKFPAKLQDLARFNDIYPLGFQALKSGDVVMNYGVKPDKVGNLLIAYEKDVPQKGGWVLMNNSKMKQMTPQEFEAAKKTAGAGG